MKEKVTRITEEVPQEAILNDGYYSGRWCGSAITIKYKGKTYILETEEGIRGSSNVIVKVDNGAATFDDIKNENP